MDEQQVVMLLAVFLLTVSMGLGFMLGAIFTGGYLL